MKVSKPLVVGAVIAAGTGIALPTLGASGNKYAPSTVTYTCGSNGSVALNGPLKLWPPNHKMVDEPVTATRGTTPGSSITLTLTPDITDATGGDGGPQHDPDFNASTSDGKSLVASGTGSSVTAGLQLRAERSGKGDGRTYTVNWTVDWGNGMTCSSSDNGQQPFVITVPHDMSGGADFAKQ